MEIKLSPKKNENDIKRIRQLYNFELFEKECQDRKSRSVSVFYPCKEEIYLRHAKFFRSIGAECCCRESKYSSNMVMEFKFDKKVTLNSEQIGVFLTIIKEQGYIMDIAVTTDDKIMVSYELFNALNERRIK